MYGIVGLYYPECLLFLYLSLSLNWVNILCLSLCLFFQFPLILCKYPSLFMLKTRGSFISMSLSLSHHLKVGSPVLISWAQELASGAGLES